MKIQYDSRIYQGTQTNGRHTQALGDTLARIFSKTEGLEGDCGESTSLCKLI